MKIAIALPKGHTREDVEELLALLRPMFAPEAQITTTDELFAQFQEETGGSGWGAWVDWVTRSNPFTGSAPVNFWVIVDPDGGITKGNMHIFDVYTKRYVNHSVLKAMGTQLNQGNKEDGQFGGFLWLRKVGDEFKCDDVLPTKNPHANAKLQAERLKLREARKNGDDTASHFANMLAAARTNEYGSVTLLTANSPAATTWED